MKKIHISEKLDQIHNMWTPKLSVNSMIII